MKLRNITILCGLAVLTAACASEVEQTAPESANQGEVSQDAEQPFSFFSDEAVEFFDGNGEAENAGPRIGVNPFLWRASLDTISFMPLAQADPFGGVIISEWHQPDGVEGERLKVNLFILGRELRADGLRASVFRQVRERGGAWVDAEIEPGTATELENAILTRARQMRISQTR